MLFDPTLNRHLVWAVNAIARELGTAARDQYGAASQGLQLVNMLDLMEVIRYPHSTFENCPEPFIASQSHPSCQSVVEMGILYLAYQIEVASVHLKQTANITGWPAHWFANLAMDLNQLNSLILVTVSHASYTPPLPVCYHAYLRHQDDETEAPSGSTQLEQNLPLPELEFLAIRKHFLTLGAHHEGLQQTNRKVAHKDRHKKVKEVLKARKKATPPHLAKSSLGKLPTEVPLPESPEPEEPKQNQEPSFTEYQTLVPVIRSNSETSFSSTEEAMKLLQEPPSLLTELPLTVFIEEPKDIPFSIPMFTGVKVDTTGLEDMYEVIWDNG
ncbi:hypothetical protein F5J12DRAFT_899130 [Pisolithus orientalis]|uniref:uncharacterized protein n=1 Tax=Pisolithus orientalis TaxID=936130 RepID=UPI0022259071|nr:uncharacterized protein F5J12DRAFT_899130 [Pisolithus orientalis]KAI5984963.1 hypothetical protein F5J12DRAFT_899130 [Pisolithus orientalis]